ncbi:MAG: MFS transporter [Chlamydiae bacterium]|nr:MFS transporter [Chlamydiota bacterium]
MVRSWVIWAISAFFLFYKYAIEVSPSVMTTQLMSEFHIDALQLGNLAGSYFLAYLILQIPVGILLDKFGPRRVTTIAILICAIGSYVFAKSTNLLSAEIGRFLTGAGAAFAAVNCLKLISIWFPPKKFAFMAGLMMSVAMLGAVFGQAPLSLFIQAVNWRFAMEVIGLIGIVLAFLFWGVVRDESPLRGREKDQVFPKIPVLKSLKDLLKNSQSWWLSIYSGFAFAPVMVFGGLFGVSFTKDAFMLSEHVAAQSVSLIFIGFAVGAPLLGMLSDYLGKRKSVMFFGTLLALVMISLIIYLPEISKTFLILAFFLFGFGISSFLLCFTMIKEINAPGLAATAIGFMNAFDAFFGAFSDPLAGKILDLFWDGKMENGARVFSLFAYKIAFLTIPIYLVLALISLYWIKETKCRHTGPESLP